MNLEISFWSFVAWIIAGMGLHVGWGLISILISVIAKSVGSTNLPT